MKKQNNISANIYSNMNDNDLIALARQKDDRAIEALFSRHRSSMVKAALHHFRKYPFDEDIKAMSPHDQEFELLSEIYVAFDNAIRRFDFKSASFSSFVNSCIMWHFVELCCNSVDRVVHEKPLSSIKAYNPDDEDEINPEDYLQYDAAKERFYDESREAEMRDAFECVMRYVPDDSMEMRVLQEIREAIDSNKRLNIASVAASINRSRQQVYNILRKIFERLPSELVQEIRELL